MVAGADDFIKARYDVARVAALIPTLDHDDPIALFRPDSLTRTAQAFQRGFPGAVSYAVKANPAREVLQTLVDTGVTTFDVASVEEMQVVRAVCPTARLHYHNPIRSRSEIDAARRFGVTSWSVDRLSELEKLEGLSAGTEIAVRLTLDRGGAAYHFGSKFGASESETVTLLRAVKAKGLVPSLTFHPGTQCTDPSAWTHYIETCATLAKAAGVRIASLNVGGGFPSGTADLADVFAAIATAVEMHFPKSRPQLWCEPGRAMVADAVWLLLKVKARSGDKLYLNDGLYGALGEWRDMPIPGQRRMLAPNGQIRRSQTHPFTIFGPTCDSLDRVPTPWELPVDTAEGDHILIQGAGAYSLALVTGFNGYGTRRILDLSSMSLEAGQPGLSG